MFLKFVQPEMRNQLTANPLMGLKLAGTFRFFFVDYPGTKKRANNTTDMADLFLNTMRKLIQYKSD